MDYLRCNQREIIQEEKMPKMVPVAFNQLNTQKWLSFQVRNRFVHENTIKCELYEPSCIISGDKDTHMRTRDTKR